MNEAVLSTLAVSVGSNFKPARATTSSDELFN